MRRVLHRARMAAGQATIEFGGMTLLLFVGALFAWQMGIVAWTDISINNAVRTAARLASRGDSISDAQTQGRNSLSGHFLQKNSLVVRVGSGPDGMSTAYASTTVPVPILFPTLFDDKLTMSAEAQLPVTN